MKISTLAGWPKKMGVQPLMYTHDQLDRQLVLDVKQQTHDDLLTELEKFVVEVDTEALAMAIELELWGRGLNATENGKAVAEALSKSAASWLRVERK